MKPSEFRSLADVVEYQARLRPASVALVDEDEVSYAQLSTRVDSVASALLAGGVTTGSRVAIMSKNSARFFECLFGVLRAGAVCAPLNWRLSEVEILTILQDFRPSVVLYEDEFAEVMRASMEEYAAAYVALEDAAFRTWLGAAVPVELPATADLADTAVVMYTSGTTGRPKGVMLPHASFAKYCVEGPEVPHWWAMGPEDVSAVAMPTFHAGGLEAALRSIFSGGKAIIMREFTPGLLLDVIETHRPSVVSLVPTALQMTLRQPRADLVDFRCIRTFFYGASPIAADLLVDGLERMDCNFVQCYGMTETNSTVVALPPEDHDERLGERMRSAGRPIANVELRVVDSEGNDTRPHEVGEILIHTAYCMTGYWERPDETAAAIDAEGWLHTGDAGYLDQDGYLYIHDRVKDMIVSGGENVYPAEVESVMFGHPDLAEVAVVGAPDPVWGEAVNAFVVLEPGAVFDEQKVIAWTRRRLAGYKTPKRVMAVDSLPKNAAGKMLKHMLRQTADDPTAV